MDGYRGKSVVYRVKRKHKNVLNMQQALWSCRAVSTIALTVGIVEPRDEPAQLHRIVDMVEAHLRQAQEETEQATQALMQVQGVLVKQRQAEEQENIDLQAKFDEEKA